MEAGMVVRGWLDGPMVQAAPTVETRDGLVMERRAGRTPVNPDNPGPAPRSPLPRQQPPAGASNVVTSDPSPRKKKKPCVARI